VDLVAAAAAMDEVGHADLLGLFLEGQGRQRWIDCQRMRYDDRTEDAAAFQVTEVICGSSIFESLLADRHANAIADDRLNRARRVNTQQTPFLTTVGDQSSASC
jgi:hypothetical protein